jgi:site-specific DNA-adenine methylase
VWVHAQSAWRYPREIVGTPTAQQTRRQLKAPFPYFGSKRQVADAVWEGLGDVANYVEPFAGSLAVLLANPWRPKVETINDVDCFVVNFWRAVSNDPKRVANFADYPVTEIDLGARHRALVASRDELRAKIAEDATFYDARAAGWWVWGICASVGSNWLQSKGDHAAPSLSSAGTGVHRPDADVHELMARLARRLRHVRILCRDWLDAVNPSITYRNRGLGTQDTTGVFLDPPYEGAGGVYAAPAVRFEDVRRWATEHGTVPNMRIALCAPSDAGEPPAGWSTTTWTPNGGYANRGRGARRREQIWFSPRCLEG